MKYRGPLGITLAGAILLGSIFAGRAESAGAGKAAAAAAPARWEYAYVLNSRTQLKCAFNSPAGSVAAEDALSLYHTLGGTKRESDFTLSDLMSHVGGQGWELVSVETQDGVAATYWFKRVAP